jgi:glycosyltransferase involved in cell wall biosynthesis
LTLRVALDASHERQPDGGISRYARQLAAALRARDDVDVLEIGGGRRETRGTVRRRAVTLAQDFVWHPWLARRKAVAEGADVYHAPGLRGPWTRGKLPTVVTVHDVVPFLYPELMSWRTGHYTRAVQRRMVRSADRVVCNSRDTARDVVSLLDVPAERVRVTPLGVDAAFFHPVPGNDPIGEPYVLFVGSEQPRKNLERLELAIEALRRRGYPHILVTAGADSWGAVRIGAPFLRRLGPVDDDRLRRLYKHAACLAIPSLHEGFGLPALEAMAVGTPVVAAAVAALPEVTGGAAVLVDPLDVDSIAGGIERAVGEGDSFRELGRANAAKFTWDRTAALTLEVYKELL